MRMVEMEGKNKNIDLKLSFPVKALLKTNLIEEVIQDTGQSGTLFNISLGRNSIETYKLELNP